MAKNLKRQRLIMKDLIKFQTKEVNIKDAIKEAIELFEHTLD